MAAEQNGVAYRRNGSCGTLKFEGVVDIFEAAALHAAAQRALGDAKATTLRAELARAESLDISAWQIMLALRRDVEASGRTFRVEGMGTPLEEAAARLGLTL